MRYKCYKCKGVGTYQVPHSILPIDHPETNITLTQRCLTCSGSGVIELEPAPIQVKIKYHTDTLVRVSKLEQGDWIDLRAAANIEMEKGKQYLVPLGISMKIPYGFEAHVVPRSSSYKNYKVIQTNGIGILDNSYCGDGDQWFWPVIAMENTFIVENDRVAQFKIVPRMPIVEFLEVAQMEDADRGGHGSTGK